MSRAFIGIDPGKKGGIAVIHPSGSVEARQLPKIGLDIDVTSLAKLMKSLPLESFAVIEAVHSISGSSAKSNFEFGESFGILKMGLSMTVTPHKLVTPKVWQKWAFDGVTPIKTVKGGNDTKAMALVAVTRMYPTLNLAPTARSTKFHTGMVDAVLLAAYARHHFNQ
jgi:hypothetical protein